MSTPGEWTYLHSIYCFSAYWLSSKCWVCCQYIYLWSWMRALSWYPFHRWIVQVVSCHCTGRWAVWNNTHGKDIGAFRRRLLYGHYHGPYFYETEVFIAVMIGQILDISIHVRCMSGHMGTLICKLTLKGISRRYRNFVMPIWKVVQVAHWYLANFWILDNRQSLYAFNTFFDWMECIDSKTEINETYHCQPKLPKIYSWCTIFLSVVSGLAWLRLQLVWLFCSLSAWIMLHLVLVVLIRPK